ncbi:hypothetical protein D3C87_1793420 [compost metagenome]
MENLPAMEELLKIKGVTKAELLTNREARIYFDGDEAITERLVAASFEHKWQIREISLEKSLLDDIFKQLSGPQAN